MSEQQESLSRDLSLFDITMIGVGAMIGAGIFVLTGEAAGTAGPSLVLAFGLNGLVALLTAMVYAELGSAIPEAGGGYLWIKEGLPGASAFLAGWMSWLAHAVAGALYALGFGAFVFELLRILSVPLAGFGLELTLSKKVFGLLIAAIFAYINYRGSSETGMAGNIVTVAKLGVIGVFCLLGAKFMFFPDLVFEVGEAPGGMGLDGLQPFIPEETGWLGILSAMGLTFIAFEGYEIIVQAGEEVKNPRRNIPKAIFLSLAVVIPLYMIVAFVLVGATNSALLVEALEAAGEKLPEGLSSAAENWKLLKHVGELGLARAASQFVPFGGLLILIGGILSTMSALNATTFSSTRVAFAMGRDRNLPDMFGRVDSRTHTPKIALLFTALLIGTMVAFVPITTVAAAADIMFLLLFLQVNLAVMTLRKKYGDKLAYGYLMPFFPILPIISIAAMLGLALFLFAHYPTAWGYALLWLGAGGLIYRFYARGRERAEEEPPIVVEERPPEVKEDAVLVAISSSLEAKPLVRLGSRIARVEESDLLLLHTVALPRQLPLSAGGRFVSEARRTLERAKEWTEKRDVSLRGMIRVAHRPGDAIVYTAEDCDPRYLILGWKGRLPRTRTGVGVNLDQVIKGTNCHTIVLEQTDEDRPPERILVPLANPETAPLAIGVAAALVDRPVPGGITVLHLSDKKLSQEERQAFRERIRELSAQEEPPEPAALFGESTPLSLEFDRSRGNIAQSIARRARDYDRVVVGMSRGGFFRRTVFGELSRQIVKRTKCPSVLVRPRLAEVRFEMQRFFQYFRELEEQGAPQED